MLVVILPLNKVWVSGVMNYVYHWERNLNRDELNQILRATEIESA
jgi:hypothetical protein